MKRLCLLLVTLLGMAILAPAQDPPQPKVFPRGAKPSPRWKLQSATPHKILSAAPAQFAVVPSKLSIWNNDVYGCCVTSQEAFAKAAWSTQCGLPELFVPDAEVKRWASKYGFLNGANLSEVMDRMAKDGFTVDGKNWKDGPYSGVDYNSDSVLQNAIFTGPVNIAIDADALPAGAGNFMGWYATGKGRFPNTDHCVALCGYGSAEYLYKQLNVPLPSALAGKSGYLLFTWNTIGFVDHDWLMSTCVEAWVRNPTTPGQAPTPPTPVPPVPPTPPTPPTPPAPGTPTLTGIVATFSDGSTQTLGGGGGLTAEQLKKMTLEQLSEYIRAKSKPAPPKKTSCNDRDEGLLMRRIALAYYRRTGRVVSP